MSIIINYQAIDDVLTSLEAIINLYSVNILNESDSLVSLDYYQEGQAKEIFDMYRQILEKMQEVGDMYYTAYRLAYNISQEMKTLDEILAGLVQNKFVFTHSGR